MYRSLDGSDTAPLHPGEILRVDILPCLSMTPAELARHLDIPRHDLDSLLAERTGITPDLAKRLGLALGHGAHHWLALQMQYDLWKATEIDPGAVRPITWSRHAQRSDAGNRAARSTAA